jgi:tetratricopeptide (TPR) repeat protein
VVPLDAHPAHCVAHIACSRTVRARGEKCGMGAGKRNNRNAAVFPSSEEQGAAAKAAHKAHRTALLAYIRRAQAALWAIAVVDGALAVWLWLAATYEPYCSNGDTGPACWLSVAIRPIWPAPAADDLWAIAGGCAALRFLVLTAGLVALQLKARRTRRTPRDFLLRTEDERLVALLPELFDAGGTINRNANAADIKEMHAEIMGSLGSPAWVAGFLSVWVDGCARPLANVDEMPADAHLKLCSAQELAEQVRTDQSPPQLLGRRWARGLGLLCLSNAIWCVTRVEFADFAGSYLSLLLLWQMAFTCVVQLAHLAHIGFRGDSLRHTGRTGCFIAWEFFVSSAVVLAAAQCGSGGAGSGSSFSASQLTKPRDFFCYIDGGPVTAELSDWRWSRGHIDAAAVSLIRACIVGVLLSCTDFVARRRRVMQCALLCALSCAVPVSKVVLWSSHQSLTLSEVCLAGVGLVLGLIETAFLAVVARRAKPVRVEDILRRGPPIPRKQGKWERRCRWVCGSIAKAICALFDEQRPPNAPAKLYRPGHEMQGADGRWYVAVAKGRKGGHVWQLREKPKGQCRRRGRAAVVYVFSRAIICGYPLCKGYAEERAKNSIDSGDRAFAAQQWRQAIPLYEAGLPVLTRTKHWYAHLVSRVHNDIGICHLALRDEVEAERSFREAIDTIERLPAIKRMPEWNTENPNVDALFNLGTQLQRRGELKTARPYLEATIAAKASYTKARLNLAVIHAELGDTAMAKAELQQVVNREPHNAQARIHRVLIRLNALGPIPKITSRSKTEVTPLDLAEMRAELDEATVDGLDNPEVAHLLACIVHAQALLLITPGFPSNVVERAQLSAVLLDGYELERQLEVEAKDAEVEEEDQQQPEHTNDETAQTAGNDAGQSSEEPDIAVPTIAPPQVNPVHEQPRRLIMSVSIDGVRAETNEAGERCTIYDLELIEHGFNRQQPFKLSRTADEWLALFKRIRAIVTTQCKSDHPEVELRPLFDWLQRCKRHVAEDCAKDASVFSLAAVARRHDALVTFLLKCPDMNESSRSLIMDFLPRPISDEPQKEPEPQPEPEPEPESEDPARIPGGFMSKAVNFLERRTGVDLDGDGDIGIEGTLIPEPAEEAKHQLSISHETEELLELAATYYETALRLQPVHIPEDGLDRKFMMPFGRLARLGQPLALDTIAEHRHHMRMREQAFTKLGLGLCLASLGKSEPAEAWCTQALRAFVGHGGFLELPAPYRIHVHYVLGRPEHWSHRPADWRQRCVGHLHQLIDLKPGDGYRDAFDLLRHWHDRQGDEASGAEYGQMWQEAHNRNPDAVPEETDPILALRHCYLPFGVAPPDVRPLAAEAGPQRSFVESDTSQDGSDDSLSDGSQSPSASEPEDIGLAAKLLTRKEGIDFFEVRRKARSVHVHLTPAEQECLDRGPPEPEQVFDKRASVNRCRVSSVQCPPHHPPAWLTLHWCVNLCIHTQSRRCLMHEALRVSPTLAQNCGLRTLPRAMIEAS